MALEGSEKGSDMVSSISTKKSYCSLRLGWENWVELDGRMLYKVRDRGWDPWGSSGGDMEWENLGILCREEYGTCWWASRGCKIVELGHIYGARNRVPVNWSGKICRSWFGGSVSFGYRRFEVFIYLEATANGIRGLMLRHHPWSCVRDHVQCCKSNWGRWHARQAPHFCTISVAPKCLFGIQVLDIYFGVQQSGWTLVVKSRLEISIRSHQWSWNSQCSKFI